MPKVLNRRAGPLGGVPREEREWARRARAGDPSAFDHLARLYRPRLHALAFSMVGSHEDAADLTQEVLLKAYSRVKSFREGSTFLTWIYRIALNHCIDFQRKRRPQIAASLEDLLEQGRSFDSWNGERGADPYRLLEAREREARVREAIQSLPERLRLVVELRELEGLSPEETARRLNCRVAAVKTRLHRARGVLRIWLSPCVG